MIGAFPGAVKRVVTFDNIGSERVSCNINGDSQVMSGKADGFDAGTISLLHTLDFQKTHIRKWDGVSGGTVKKNEVLGAPVLLKQRDDVLFFFVGCHTEG